MKNLCEERIFLLSEKLSVCDQVSPHIKPGITGRSNLIEINWPKALFFFRHCNKEAATRIVGKSKGGIVTVSSTHIKEKGNNPLSILE